MLNSRLQVHIYLRLHVATMLPTKILQAMVATFASQLRNILTTRVDENENEKWGTPRHSAESGNMSNTSSDETADPLLHAFYSAVQVQVQMMSEVLLNL